MDFLTECDDVFSETLFCDPAGLVPDPCEYQIYFV